VQGERKREIRNRWRGEREVCVYERERGAVWDECVRCLHEMSVCIHMHVQAHTHLCLRIL
jgi:hypothetical protein